jgi:hypothetical protein
MICLRCGRSFERQRYNAYCSDSCRAEARASGLTVNRANAWAFATDERLYMALDHRDRVTLWPRDLERVEKHRAVVRR